MAVAKDLIRPLSERTDQSDQGTTMSQREMSEATRYLCAVR